MNLSLIDHFSELLSKGWSLKNLLIITQTLAFFNLGNCVRIPNDKLSLDPEVRSSRWE